jgi:hypothetical protein
MIKQTFLVGATLAVLASPAAAACLDEINALSPGTTTGSVSGTAPTMGQVSKDGSTAPLQSANNQQQGTSARTAGVQASTADTSNQSGSKGRPGIAKDGSTMPMAQQPGGNANIATSAQDAQAQQRGGQVASNAAGGGTASASGSHSPQMMAALDRARTMAQQGNESGCMQAVQDAKKMQ